MTDPEFKEEVKRTLELLKDQLLTIGSKVTQVQEETSPMTGNGSFFRTLTFSGLSKEDARSFLEKFLAQADLGKWNDDKKLRIFKLAMTDMAEIWHRELSEETRSDWSRLVAAFNKKFRNEDDK